MVSQTCTLLVCTLRKGFLFFFFKVKFYIYEVEREKSLLHNIVGRIKSDSALKTQHASHVLARLACFASCCRAAAITWPGFDEALKGGSGRDGKADPA